MVLDEEARELPRGLWDPHPLQGPAGHLRSDRDVVAGPCLSDVVEQRTQKQTISIAYQPRGLHGHVIVPIGSAQQPSDMAKRLEQMDVDGIAVVRVALRPATDGAPSRDQPREEPDRVHRLQGAHALVPGPQDPHEGVAQVVAPGSVSRRRGSLEAIQHTCGHHAVLGGDVRERPDGILDGFDRPLPGRDGLATKAPIEHRSDDVLDLPRVLEHRAHQSVDGTEPGFVAEPHVARDLRLLLEVESVDPPPGLEVNRAPDANEEFLRRGHVLPLSPTEQLGSVHLEQPRSALEGGPQPTERRHVSQSARSLLQVRLQKVGDRAEALAPAEDVFVKPDRESAQVASKPHSQALAHLRPRGSITGQDAAVEHGRGRIQPLLRDVDALLGGPDRMAHHEAGVPQRVQEALGDGRDRRRVAARVKDQQIDVRRGRELRSPVATKSHQRDAGANRRVGEQLTEARVDELGAASGRPPAVMPGCVRLIQRQELLEQPGNRGRTVMDLRARRGPSPPCGCG